MVGTTQAVLIGKCVFDVKKDGNNVSKLIRYTFLSFDCEKDNQLLSPRIVKMIREYDNPCEYADTLLVFEKCQLSVEMKLGEDNTFKMSVVDCNAI